MTKSNQTPIDEFIEDINTELQNIKKSWMTIGRKFYEAREQYTEDSDAYKKLMKETDFDKSKASKLVKIGGDKRLLDPLLKEVKSYTVLYEAALLDDDQFEVLKAKLKEGEKLTEKLAKDIRQSASEVETDILIDAFEMVSKVTARTISINTKPTTIRPIAISDGIIRNSNEAGSMLARVDISKRYSGDFYLNDVSQLLRVYDAMSEPKLEIDEDQVIVTDHADNSQFVICKDEDTNEKKVDVPAFTKSTLTETDAFVIEKCKLQTILRMAKLSNLPDLVISADGKNLTFILCTLNHHKEGVSPTIKIEGYPTNAQFEFALSIKSLERVRMDEYEFTLVERDHHLERVRIVSQGKGTPIDYNMIASETGVSDFLDELLDRRTHAAEELKEAA